MKIDAEQQKKVRDENSIWNGKFTVFLKFQVFCRTILSILARLYHGRDIRLMWISNEKKMAKKFALFAFCVNNFTVFICDIRHYL